MSTHMLKLNDDKTEFLFISSSYFQNHFPDLSFLIGDATIRKSVTARNLGVMFDSTLSMSKQVTSICKSAYYHIRNIGSIRKYLTHECASILIHAFITSRIDYCNSLLAGISDYNLQRIQRVQNTAARILSLTRKFDHITPVLKQLHWLPVRLRIHFKILLLTYRVIHGTAPVYLCDLLKPLNHSRSLRSTDKELLLIPRTRLKNYGERSFSVIAPRLWNDLPISLRRSPSINAFKSGLKTVLFKTF